MSRVVSRVGSRFLVVGMAALLATGWMTARPRPALAVSPNIVISQVYGGGGNTGATYTNDFIELFNRGTVTVDVSAWSVQYASSSGTTWQRTNLGGSIPPGGYYLVQEAAGAGGTTPLPTPDAAGSIAMSATSGKVALVANQTTLSGTCPAVQDFVGYGAANCFETAAAPVLTNTTADLRAAAGCTDTDSNVADFASGAPSPRNSATPANVCTTINLTIDDVTATEGDSGTTSFDFTVSLSEPAPAGGVTFDIATQDGTATDADNDYEPKSLLAQTIPAASSTYTFTVDVNGDLNSEANETFFVNVSNVTGASITDGQGLGGILDEDSCNDSFTPIHQIQGNGTSAAITGTVTTAGVVVGDFEGTAANAGFFIQDPAGDGDQATSDGIFVFAGSNDFVTAGEYVRVTGYARERFSQTTINGSNSNSAAVSWANVIHCGTDVVTPTDVLLPFADAGFPERYEGMLVRLPQSLTIAEYFNYDRFGEIVLALPLDGEDRPYTGTAKDEPGTAANARTAANALRRITLDDNQSGSNPAVLRHPNGDPFSLDNLFRGGDLVTDATGVLGYDFNLYRIFPTQGADYESVNPRPAAPTSAGGRLRVGAMNTLNFFVTADIEPNSTPPSSLDNQCGPSNTLECRGWDSNQPDEFTRQRDKLLQALVGLNADVLGLNELENTADVEPLESIVDGLNDLLGPDTYDFIDTGTIGTDAIKVGLIYKPDAVTPIGDFALLTTAVDARFLDAKNRPALAQTFEENATGERFTIVVNHFKSKGSNCNDVSDPDLGDGQGNCSQTRRAAAEALVDWLATDPTGSGDPDFLIVGDLNSYAKEQTIAEIIQGADDVDDSADDWTNLIDQFIGDDAYSYVFDGQAGYLDHALSNASLTGQVTGASEWHINADEPDVLDYDMTFKPPSQDALYEPNAYRTSDHDPVLVGLALNAPPVYEFVAGGNCAQPGAGGSFLVNVSDVQTAAGDLSLTLTGNTNTTLIPDANVAISGSATRTISIVAANRQTGAATLTFSLGDGVNTVTFTIGVQIGTDADEVLTGGAGPDLLVGNQGDDTLLGLGGADVLCGSNGNDALDGGAGPDTLDGGYGNDALVGGTEDDVLRGNRGNDTLTGDDGADAFSGGQGVDVLADYDAGEGDTSDGT